MLALILCGAAFPKSQPDADFDPAIFKAPPGTAGTPCGTST